MSKQKKELNLIIQFNGGYGYGWEDVSFYPCGIRQSNYWMAWEEARKDLKEYVLSGGGDYRIIRRYELIEGEE